MPEQTNPVIEKYRSISTGGWNAAQESGLKEFSEFPEAIRHRFNVAALLTPESRGELTARILTPLSEQAARVRTQLFLAGNDFPIHCTILESTLPDDLRPQEQQIYNRLSQELSSEPVITQLAGKKMTFDDLLVDRGGNVILVARQISQVVLDSRITLAQKYASAGLAPILMENILHISLARPTQLGPDQRSYYRFPGLRTETRRHPLEMQIDYLHIGTVEELLSLSI